MKLGYLQAFLAVAESLHFGNASKAVNLSQPALSRQIQALEEEIGVSLFVRNHRKTSLTLAGEVFIEEAREMLLRFEQATRRALRAELGQSGRLRVGFVSTAAALLVPTLVKRFSILYPEVELELRNVLTMNQIKQLCDRELDVGLLRVPITAPKEISTEILHSEPFVMFLPASHPHAQKPHLKLGHLQDADFVMIRRRGAPGFHDRIMGIFKRAGFSPHIVQEADEMYTLISLVAAALGIAILPSSVQCFITSGIVVRGLPATVKKSEIALAVNTNHVSAITQKFMDLALATSRIMN
jgi:DNA-binding transcriptional LysR family regulator